MNHHIYLDHSATTPTDTRVVTTMQPYFSEIYGNTLSSHHFGQKAEHALEQARETIARILNCQATEIIFTSGGSESDNLAIRGTAWATEHTGQGQHIITTATEHDAIGKTIDQLTQVMGFNHSILSVDHNGLCPPEAPTNHYSGTAITSIIYANNEVGTINPIPELATSAHKQGWLFHTDAVQAAGQLSLNVKTLNIDLMSISGHKFYGPKGVGLLYVKEGTPLIPTQTGGNHEDGRRAGTHNLPLIIGLAKAFEIAYDELDEHTTHYKMLRDQLIDGILSTVPNAQLTGHPEKRLPSHASFIFDGIESNTLLTHLDLQGIAASSGSACKTGNPEPSSVLLAMGYSESAARSSLRLTVGRQNTAEEIDYTIKAVAKSVEKLRRIAYMRQTS